MVSDGIINSLFTCTKLGTGKFTFNFFWRCLRRTVCTISWYMIWGLAFAPSINPSQSVNVLIDDDSSTSTFWVLIPISGERKRHPNLSLKLMTGAIYYLWWQLKHCPHLIGRQPRNHPWIWCNSLIKKTKAKSKSTQHHNTDQNQKQSPHMN